MTKQPYIAGYVRTPFTFAHKDGCVPGVTGIAMILEAA